MSGINDFLDLMPSAITIEALTGRDSYNTPSYAAPVSYRCRCNYKAHFVRGPEGELIPAKGTLWIASSVRIPVTSRITLPDGTQPQILESVAETDETGAILYCRIDFG